MGRTKLPQGDAKTATISFRASADVPRRIEAAINGTGVAKSDVYRHLIQGAKDSDIARAVKRAQVEKIEAMSALSVAELKQKRQVAVRTLAWIDAELKKAAAKIK